MKLQGIDVSPATFGLWVRALLEQAEIALAVGAWADARRHLDTLNQHLDYARAKISADLSACPAAYRPILADRIELWNSAVVRNGGAK